MYLKLILMWCGITGHQRLVSIYFFPSENTLSFCSNIDFFVHANFLLTVTLL